MGVADVMDVDATVEAARSLAGEYARLIRARWGDRIRGIWLYGSAARGDWTPESDIDVLVILDREDQEDAEWLVKTAYRLGLAEKHLLLQPVMLTNNQFRHLVERERRFALDVLQEGMAL